MLSRKFTWLARQKQKLASGGLWHYDPDDLTGGISAVESLLSMQSNVRSVGDTADQTKLVLAVTS
jgi:hypothetical protein